MLALLVELCVPAAQASELVAPAVDGRTRERPSLFLDDQGAPAIAVGRLHPDRAGAIETHWSGSSGWSTGQALALGTGNFRTLQHVSTLDGRPAAVFLYDETDYLELYQVDRDQPADTPFPVDPGELLSIMGRSQRVYLSTAVMGAWTRPVGVMGTRGAVAARLDGGEGCATLAVLVDTDGDTATTHDAELRVLTRQAGVWSEPRTLASGLSRWTPLAVRSTATGGVVAWSVDADADVTTTDDQSLLVAEVAGDGAVVGLTTIAESLQSAGPLQPVLTERAGATAVLWSGEAADGEGQGVWESRKATGWSVPVETGVRGVGAMDARELGELDDASVVALRQGDQIQLAFGTDVGWFVSDPLLSLGSDGTAVREWDALLADETLHIAITGRVGPGGRVSAADGEALRYAAAPLAAELAVVALDADHRRVRPGVAASVRGVVRNVGSLPAQDVTVALLGADAEGEWEVVPTLWPGDAQIFAGKGIFHDAAGRWGMQVMHADGAGDTADNERWQPTPVLPDYTVLEVVLEHGSVRAEIRDLAQAQGPPIQVSFNLEEPGGSSTLETLEFDPRRPHALVVEVPHRDASHPWRVVVRANPHREVREADYSNNVASVQNLGLVDLDVDEVWVERGAVHVSVVGGPADQTVGVWVTDDPVEAAAALQSGWRGSATPVYLDHSGRGVGVVDLPSSSGLQYAVVNPGHAIRETTRANNTEKFTAGRRRSEQSDLRFVKTDGDCGALQLVFRNDGVVPALASAITLRRGDGLPMGEAMIPQTNPGETVSVTVEGVEAGSYAGELLRLDRWSERALAFAVDSFEPLDSLDYDRDGFEDAACGGLDCDDRDGSNNPRTRDENCRVKHFIGCDGCGGGQAAGLLLLLPLASLRRRRDPRGEA